MTRPQADARSAPAFRSDGDVAICVPDLSRAEAFYSGVLGFRLLERSDDHLHYATGAFDLWVNRDPEALRSFIPALEVPDYDAARARLVAAGCTIVRDWPEQRGLWFADPFGFTLDVIERKTPRS
jgi:catechol 2,3-dioxygenase-like lactoylglutathione lyase family enzyme